MLKTSNIKQKIRLRRAKSVKNNLNTSISPFLKSKKKHCANSVADFV